MVAGDHGVGAIALAKFVVPERDRVEEPRNSRSLLRRIGNGLPVPKCSSEFTAGSNLNFGNAMKDVCGIAASVCNHGISDEIYGLLVLLVF